MAQLDGELALVTGASRGIGQAIAVELGKRGATVIGTATTQNGADGISAHLNEQQITGGGLCLNVTDAEQVDAVLAQLEQQWGRMPSILINNAGITRDNLLMRMKDAEWDAVIATNLTAVFRLSRLCVASMIKARKGRIVTITSVVGFSGNPGQANYAATKAGVVGFAKSLAREVGARGVTINCVAPGFIDTDMTRVLSDTQKTAMLANIPLKRLGQAAEVAAAVAFLASPEAGYITGETLHVNGGMYMV